MTTFIRLRNFALATDRPVVPPRFAPGLSTTHGGVPTAVSYTHLEHRMFSFISMNWRGRPLVSYRTIIELIAATTTASGLTIRAEQDHNSYEKGIKVSDAELAAIPLIRHEFHGDWNYTLTARPKVLSKDR